jgi:hypothetical protein
LVRKQGSDRGKNRRCNSEPTNKRIRAAMLYGVLDDMVMWALYLKLFAHRLSFLAWPELRHQARQVDHVPVLGGSAFRRPVEICAHADHIRVQD